MATSNSGVSTAKKLKCTDNISSLPTKILQHILSFLDMEVAVRTCVLSPRWRHLWVSLPTLNFDFQSDEDDVRFLKFVDNVFILRDGSDLQKFHLSYCDNEDRDLVPHQVYSWVLSSVRRNVQELVLDVTTNVIPDLPSCLFTCETLIFLKLEVSGFDIIRLLLPSLINLPRLKQLYLGFVCLDIDLTNAPFSKCPVLESLTISTCGVSIPENTLDICIPSLKHFRFECPLATICEPISKLQIQAPNLVSYTYEGCAADVYFPPEGIPSLLNAEMCLYAASERSYKESNRSDAITEDEEISYDKHMIRSLKAVCNVNTLTLSPWAIEIVSQPHSTLRSLSTKFLNLKRMHLESWLSSECIKAIIYLLEISPKLETLEIEVTEEYPNFLNKGESSEFRQCMLCHLKYVKIQGMRGWENELKFLEMLLKNAGVLEKMVISVSEEPDREEKVIEFTKKLLNFPRASSGSAILFQ